MKISVCKKVYKILKQEGLRPWVTHLGMTVYKVRGKHYLTHHPAMMRVQKCNIKLVFRNVNISLCSELILKACVQICNCNVVLRNICKLVFRNVTKHVFRNVTVSLCSEM